MKEVLLYLSAGWEGLPSTMCVTSQVVHIGNIFACSNIPHGAAPARSGVRFWCGMGESNSQPEFGKLLFYH